MPREDYSGSLHVLTCTFRTIDEWNHANLSAPYWRVYWNDREGWEVWLGRCRQALRPDRLVVIPPDTPYSAFSRNAAGHLYVHFVAGSPFDRHSPALITQPLLPWWRRLVEELAQLCVQGRSEEPSAILRTRLLCYYALSIVPADHWVELRVDPRVSAAQRSMELHVRNPLDNAALAREAAMNTNAFIRLFRSQTGLTPQAWYTRYRIEYACRLLHHSHLSIKQIAEETGFWDRAHFSRVFRRYRGMGPAEFRKRGIAPG